MERKLRRCAERKSTLMREYFNSHYVDPAYLIINKNKYIKEQLQARAILQEGFEADLRTLSSSLYDRFDEITSMYLSIEVFMLEEAYILGVQDRDRVLQLQE